MSNPDKPSCSDCRLQGVTLELVPPGTVFLGENAKRGLRVKYVRHQPREATPLQERTAPAVATA